MRRTQHTHASIVFKNSNRSEVLPPSIRSWKKVSTSDESEERTPVSRRESGTSPPGNGSSSPRGNATDEDEDTPGTSAGGPQSGLISADGSGRTGVVLTGAGFSSVTMSSRGTRRTKGGAVAAVVVLPGGGTRGLIVGGRGGGRTIGGGKGGGKPGGRGALMIFRGNVRRELRICAGVGWRSSHQIGEMTKICSREREPMT